MTILSRILLVEDSADEWHAALHAMAGTGQMNETLLVKDEDEALDFLLNRRAYRQRPLGLPAVVLLGPSLTAAKALSLLAQIRRHSVLAQVPVVLMHAGIDRDVVRSAYDQGANSVVCCHEPGARAQRYAAVGHFWAGINEPPAGCIRKARQQAPHA
jgi:CheY-like chemotaxis protein